MKNNGAPLYRSIYLDIVKKINDGNYKKNSLLPSETELQEIYNVSRITVRRAVEELQNDGYVLKQPGVGTLVINEKFILNLKGIHSFSSENPNESSLLVSFSVVSPPINIKLALDLRDNDKVYQIERIRKSNGIVIGFHRAYVPVHLIELIEGDFNSSHNSLYKKLEKEGIKLTHGSETIEAVNADSFLVNLLDVPKNTSIMYKERISMSNDVYVEFVEMFYIGSAYKYYVELKNI